MPAVTFRDVGTERGVAMGEVSFAVGEPSYHLIHVVRGFMLHRTVLGVGDEIGYAIV